MFLKTKANQESDQNLSSEFNFPRDNDQANEKKELKAVKR